MAAWLQFFFGLGMGVGLSVGGAWLWRQWPRNPRRIFVQFLRDRFGHVETLHEGDLRIGPPPHSLTLPHLLVSRLLDANQPDRVLGQLLAEITRARDWAEREPDAEPSLDQLLPVIVPTLRMQIDSGRNPLALPVAESLEVALLDEEDGSPVWLSERQGAALENPRALLNLALNNLRARSLSMTIAHQDVDSTEVFRLVEEDGLDSARILLRDLWEPIEERVGGELIFAIPSRDRLYITRRDNPEAVAIMLMQAQEDWSRRPNPISPHAWIRDNNRLVPWKAHA